MIQIKALTEELVPNFVDVHLACFRDCYQGIFAEEVFAVREEKKAQRIMHIKKRLKNSQEYFYYALCDDFSVVGVLIFSIVNHQGLLDAIYLKKEYQKCGYGTKLIQAMELTLQQLGITEYVIYVSKLISANEFFQKKKAVYIEDEPISIHGKDYLECEYFAKVGDNI